MNAKSIKLLYIDLFCGAGGTSTGVEQAQRHGAKCAKVIACVNHDANAIASHSANHPDAMHFTEDIRTLELSPLVKHVHQMRSLFPGAKVVLWASLECTNHSRAKGGMSRDADSRTLAEHLFRYIDTLAPDYIQIENVTEFMEWGPLVIKVVHDVETGIEYCPLNIKRHPKTKAILSIGPVFIPDPDNKGIFYRKWVGGVKQRGFKFDHCILNSADFGAYTSRTRFFGQFARPELPIAWPKPTHTKTPVRDLFSVGLKPWRPVKEVLDFEDRGESIFTRKKPLVAATLERIMSGLIKFVAGGRDAFLVKYNSTSQQKTYIAPGIDASCPIVSTQGRLALARVDFLSKYFSGNPDGKNISVEEPSGAIMPHDHHAFVSAYYGNGYNSPVNQPAPTVTTKDRFQLVQPFLVSQYSGGGQPASIESACPTLTTVPKQQLVNVHYLLNPQFNSVGGCVDSPCFTLIARMDKRPPYLVSVAEGIPALTITSEDSPEMIRIKEFCIMYGIVDVTMRMLRIPELKMIQGFARDYKLIGTSDEQKKFIGNAVEVNTAAALCAATAGALEKMENQIAA